jgi:hypothetical protein
MVTVPALPPPSAGVVGVGVGAGAGVGAGSVAVPPSAGWEGVVGVVVGRGDGGRVVPPPPAPAGDAGAAGVERSCRARVVVLPAPAFAVRRLRRVERGRGWRYAGVAATGVVAAAGGAVVAALDGCASPERDTTRPASASSAPRTKAVRLRRIT